MEHSGVFEDVMEWLRKNYGAFQFFVERDVVWTVQNCLSLEIRERSLPWRVFNDYPILPGKRRALCVDLAVLDVAGTVVIAVEFKFEPSHLRGQTDIWPSKFPVMGWSDVAHDMMRCREFIAQGKADAAYSVLIDEGSFFRHRVAHPAGEWRDWDIENASDRKVAVHWYAVSQCRQESLIPRFPRSVEGPR